MRIKERKIRFESVDQKQELIKISKVAFTTHRILKFPSVDVRSVRR